MRKIFSNRVMIFISVLLALLFFLAGCKTEGTKSPTITSAPPTQQSSPSPTSLPARLGLFDPVDTASVEIVSLLTEFASANALAFEKIGSLESGLEGMQVLVLLATPENLPDLLTNLPKTQFILVGSTGLQDVSNLSVIQTKADDMAFMAGFLASITSDDWRSGALLLDDTSNLALKDAFENGARYLCGQCTPLYPPFISYPEVLTLTSGSDVAAWVAQASTLLVESDTNAIFIDRAGDFSDLVAQFEGQILYTNDPSSPNIQRYAAVLGVDALAGLQQILPEVLAGAGGKTLNMKVMITVNNNPDAVTPGRVDYFNRVAQDLADGWINPLSVP
jgi:hypothetical protein